MAILAERQDQGDKAAHARTDLFRGLGLLAQEQQRLLK